MYQLTAKAYAMIDAIEAGLIPRDAAGNYDLTTFRSLWDIFSAQVARCERRCADGGEADQ